MKREDKEFYRELRKGGVPFVDAHLLARQAWRDPYKVFEMAGKMNWAKKGPGSYYGHDPEDRLELHYDRTIKLPRDGYLVNDSLYGVYVLI